MLLVYHLRDLEEILGLGGGVFKGLLLVEGGPGFILSEDVLHGSSIGHRLYMRGIKLLQLLYILEDIP